MHFDEEKAQQNIDAEKENPVSLRNAERLMSCFP